MWQTYSLLATAFQCLENITDKRAMNGEIDADVASFIRVLLYCLLVVPITALFGHAVSWYCSPGIILFGLASAVMASAYTLVLRIVDVTTLSALSYVAPLIFLAIDSTHGSHLTVTQVLAIVGLVVGGIGFALNGRVKLSLPTLALLAVMFVYSGAEFYYVQHVNRTERLSGISFFANVWGWASVFLGANLLLRRKLPKLLDRTAITYARFSVLGKSFDAASSLFSGLALTATTVAQYSAMQVFYPPVMLAFAMVAQVIFSVDLGERVDRRAIGRKASMALLLVISGKFA